MDFQGTITQRHPQIQSFNFGSKLRDSVVVQNLILINLNFFSKQIMFSDLDNLKTLIIFIVNIIHKK